MSISSGCLVDRIGGGLFLLLLPLVGYLYRVSGEHAKVNPNPFVVFITGFHLIEAVVVLVIAEASF